MRALVKSLLATSCAVAFVATGCSERNLRPLTPCTTAGASASVNIDDVKNVDLLFMVDNSGSMRQEQAKLRAEFPTMVRALLSGDTDGDNNQDYPPVQSLRIAVITSDMGVGGVGTTPETTTTKISGCGANAMAPGGIDFARAHYGDDGAFRTQQTSLRITGQLQVDCDVDNDGNDDVVAAADLPAFLTFDQDLANPPTMGEVDDYVRRVSCFTNVGTLGCAFEQQLESTLKALTPSTYTPVGGPFHFASGQDARGLGQGDDTETSIDPAANGGWLRDDSLLAVVLVTDEDDCSASDPTVFDFNSTVSGYADMYTRYQSQTRCARYQDLVHNTQRYVEGLRRLREGRERLLVFGAITGVPPELTDGDTNAGDFIEGTSNIQEILDDANMQYTGIPENQPAGPGNTVISVPNAQLRPACVHTEPDRRFQVTGDTTDASLTVTNVTVTQQPPGAVPTINATGNTTSGSATLANVMMNTAGSAEFVEGMAISGAGIAAGTIVVRVQGDFSTTGPYTLFLSQAATATASGVAVSVGGSFGPAIGQLVTGPGIPYATVIDGVAGTGPYTITLRNAATATATGAAMEIGTLDVSATPARRASLVARDLRTLGVNVTLQSICVDDFGPAMGQILRLIQSNLAGSCLPRPFNRNALALVNCDVFVTLPPNTTCAGTPGMEPTPESLVPTANTLDADGQLERCVMIQRPVQNQMVSGAGWFYDDFTTEVDSCGALTQRISFTTGAKPPEGSVMKFGCIQPVQDGELEVDINSACASVSECAFSTDATRDAFVDRYNLEPRGWTLSTDPDHGSDTNALICEPNFNTCQVACTTDADCPGGFVCYDPSEFNATLQSVTYCVNPTCGSGE